MIVANEWNSLETAKFISGLLTPLMITIFGYYISSKFKKRDAELESLKEIERDELERKHTPHIELNIEADFHGVRDGLVLTTFIVTAKNQGCIYHKFDNIRLRLRGIKDENFQLWEEHEPIAHFPHKLLETNMVHPGWGFIFIEPGVSQQIKLTTLIPSNITYIIAHVEFEYKKYWPHTAEAVFAIPESV